MAEATQSPLCVGCPLYGKSRGFCLGSGDPTTAKMMVVLEAPGSQEVVTRVTPEELQIRKRDYPELDERWLKLGVPAVGPTGMVLESWVWKKLGIRREETFVDNVLRCLPKKGKNGEAYPTGEERKAAELHCRQYDRIGKFAPDCAVVSVHPASLLRGEVTMLPLLVKDFEKVRDFTAQGRRVLALLGGKAAHAYLRYASNVTRWRGTYQALGGDWSDTYKSLFEYTRKKKVKVMVEGVCGKKHRGVKKAPNCGYVGCVEDFQRRTTNEIPSISVE